jgi:hypothetical protein
MVIFGKSEVYAELLIREPLLGGEGIRIELNCGVDWGLLADTKDLSGWEKEYKRNIHKAKPAVIILNDEETRPRRFTSYKKKGNKKNKLTFKDYRREWGACDYPPGGLTAVEYAEARAKGFTLHEISMWGDLILLAWNTPENLRAVQMEINKKTAAEMQKIAVRQAQREFNEGGESNEGNEQCKPNRITAASNGNRRHKSRKSRRLS